MTKDIHDVAPLLLSPDMVRVVFPVPQTLHVPMRSMRVMGSPGRQYDR